MSSRKLAAYKLTWCWLQNFVKVLTKRLGKLMPDSTWLTKTKLVVCKVETSRITWWYWGTLLILSICTTKMVQSFVWIKRKLSTVLNGAIYMLWWKKWAFHSVWDNGSKSFAVTPRWLLMSTISLRSPLLQPEESDKGVLCPLFCIQYVLKD